MNEVQEPRLICGACGESFEERHWIQPPLIEGEAPTVAFAERECACGCVPLGTVDIDPDVGVALQSAHELAEQFLPGLLPDPYEAAFAPQGNARFGRRL